MLCKQIVDKKSKRERGKEKKNKKNIYKKIAEADLIKQNCATARHTGSWEFRTIDFRRDNARPASRGRFEGKRSLSLTAATVVDTYHRRHTS